MLHILTILIIASTKLFAIDCDGLSNNEEIRLDTPGKSLETFKTQDQDGLGTCAANSTSLLLHSLLPNNPDLSYLQMASIYRQEDLNTKRAEASDKNNFEVYAKPVVSPTAAVAPATSEIEALKRWELGIDSANTCIIIDKIKKYQNESPDNGICQSGTVTLERTGAMGDQNWKQKKSLLAISQYMNEFQKNFSENKVIVFTNQDTSKKNTEARIKYHAFQNALEKQIKNKEIIFNQKCQTFSTEMFGPVLKSMNYDILKYQACFTPGHDSDSPCNVFSKILNVTTQEDGTMNVEYNSDFQNSLVEIFKNTNAPGTNEEVTAKMFQAILNTAKSPLDVYSTKMMKEILTKISPNTLVRLSDEMKEITANGFSKKCNDRELMDYLTSDDFKTDAKKDVVLCQSTKLLGIINNVIASTAQTNLADIDTVRTFLLKDANLNYDEAIKKLYAFDCLGSEKIRIPESVSCKEQEVTTQHLSAINEKIVEELKHNRAVGGYICASILDKPKSDFFAGECGSHAIGLVGVKCVDGAMKYLIQNSWGKGNKAKNPALTNTDNGSYWFDEQSFVDGFKSISVLEIQ